MLLKVYWETGGAKTYNFNMMVFLVVFFCFTKVIVQVFLIIALSNADAHPKTNAQNKRGECGKSKGSDRD